GSPPRPARPAAVRARWPAARPAPFLRPVDAHARPAAGGRSHLQRALEGPRAAVTTRAEFLSGLRREMAKTRGLFEASSAERPPDADLAFETVNRQMAERWPQVLERFRAEFERIAGVFHRVARLEDVSGVGLGIVREKQASRVLSWCPDALGLDLRQSLGGEGLSVTLAPDGDPDGEARRVHREAAAETEIGVTGTDWALAETGTLILVSGRGRPRS